MRKKFVIHLRAVKPRNPIIQAAVLGLVKLGGSVHRNKTRSERSRARQQSRLDLDDLVRLGGEW